MSNATSYRYPLVKDKGPGRDIANLIPRPSSLQLMINLGGRHLIMSSKEGEEGHLSLGPNLGVEEEIQLGWKKLLFPPEFIMSSKEGTRSRGRLARTQQ